MECIGHIDSLWRYPVKSMRGERSSRHSSGSLGSMATECMLSMTPALPRGSPT